MTYLVERLAELKRHLDHLRAIAPRATDRAALERVPGFRNVIVHDYVALDLDRVLDALRRLAPVDQFVTIVAGIERSEPEGAQG